MERERPRDTPERSRLEQRSRRVEVVIDVLRELAGRTAGDGDAPLALQEAIAGFREELATVRRQLRAYDRAPRAPRPR